MFEVALLPRNLEAALRDCDAKRVEVRKSAVRDLVRHADGDSRARVVSALARILAADNDLEVRALAAVAGADAGIVEMRPELMSALADPAPRVTQMALLALGELVSSATDDEVIRVRSFLRSELPALRYQALSTLSHWTEREALGDVIEAVRDPDAEMRWLGWHLLDIWQETSSARSDAPTLLEAKVAVFGALGDLPALCDKVQRDVDHVRAEAVSFLLRLDADAAWPLAESLLDRPKGLEPGQLERLLERLGETGCAASIPWLRSHARRGWFEGRLGWASLVALAQLGDAMARASILSELRVSSLRRRERALDAVCALRMKEAEGTLLAMTKEVPRELSEAAKRVLSQLRERQ